MSNTNSMDSFEECFCYRCGALLTSPLSIRRGIGPQCLRIMQEKYPHLTTIFALER